MPTCSKRTTARRPLPSIQYWGIDWVQLGSKTHFVLFARTQFRVYFPRHCRVSSVVEQRFCKPLVGGSNPSPGTRKINVSKAIPGGQSSQKMLMGRTWEDRIRGKRPASPHV